MRVVLCAYRSAYDSGRRALCKIVRLSMARPLLLLARRCFCCCAVAEKLNVRAQAVLACLCHSPFAQGETHSRGLCGAARSDRPAVGLPSLSVVRTILETPLSVCDGLAGSARPLLATTAFCAIHVRQFAVMSARARRRCSLAVAAMRTRCRATERDRRTLPLLLLLCGLEEAKTKTHAHALAHIVALVASAKVRPFGAPPAVCVHSLALFSSELKQNLCMAR